MAQTHKKTGTCSRPTGAQTDYPMYLVVGESEYSYTFYQTWTTQPYATTNQTTVNSTGGILDVTSTGTDAYIHMNALGSFNPADHKYIQIKYKVVSGTAGTVSIFFYNTRKTGADPSQEVSAALTSDNAWHTLNVDMSANEYWDSSNVTGWRFDWCSANSVNMQIDYIALVLEVDVHCSGHCQDDFGDIRFHNAADASLDYWIDWGTLTGTTPNQSVGVWVAPSPGTSDTNVVIKYGDAALTDASDSSIFIKYKDFESGSDGDSIATADEDWTVGSGTVEIDTAQKHLGTRSMKLVGAATGPGATLPLTAASNSYMVSVWARKTNTAGKFYPLLHGNGTKRIAVFCDSSENIQYRRGDDTWIDTGVNCTIDTWQLYEARNIDFSAGTFDLWFEGACIVTGAELNTNAGEQDVLRFYCDAAGTGADSWIDDLIVRKYASPEPTWGTWGAEEEISSGSNADISCGIASLVISAVADFDIVAPIDISCGVAALGISASADFSIVAPGPVTATLSQAFREAVAKKEIDFLNDTFKIILMGADFEYDPETHGTLADVTSEQLPTGYGYTQDSKTLTGVAGEFNYDGYYSVTWDDASWTANGWPIGPTSAAIIYDYTHADQVVAYALQFGENRTVHNGFNLKIMGLEVIL